LLLIQSATSSAVADASRSSAIDQLDRTITVTGRSLQASGEALAQCLERKCSPAEDIRASIEHAENQLIAGELQGARTTLLRSRGRNKRYAQALPDPVSRLLHFDAEVASLLGLADYGRIATIDSLDALKGGLPADDPRIAMQRLRVGDVFMREGRHATAVKMYDAVAERAAEAGWRAIQGAAMFRALTFYAMAASVDPSYRGQAQRRYAALRATQDEALRPARDASAVLQAKLSILSSKSADIEAVMAGVSGTRTKTPMLVFMPRVDLASAQGRSKIVPAAITRDQWADFVFRITPEGTVADVEIVNKASKIHGGWLAQVEQALARRRYLPLDLPSESPGLWRRERFMIVANLTAPKASRIRTLSGPPILRSIDLTARSNPPIPSEPPR
jgi:tetratricopeptide (TPR) repeat protein